MELEKIGVTPAKEKQFNKKGIFSVEDLIKFYPRNYIDCTVETGILPEGNFSVFTVFVRDVQKYSNKTPLIIARCTDVATKQNVNVLWFHQMHLYNSLLSYIGTKVIVAGKPVYNEQYKNYSLSSPFIFSDKISAAKRIHPVYSKIPGMSGEYLQTKINAALLHTELMDDVCPKRIIDKNGLLDTLTATYNLHIPSCRSQLIAAHGRIIFDDLLYFALKMETARRKVSSGSQYNIKTLKTVSQIINSLPYTLTEDQENILKELIGKAKTGQRINALVQGGVGSGKSIVAFLCMVAMADSGYQSVLLAPTQVLARQHYEDLCALIAPYGFKAAYFGGGKLKKAEKQELLNGIASGEIQFIVGTHAVLNPDFVFHKLSLVIVDEEHKFGVIQRNALTERAASGVHSISMSATPIPRSLAQVIYGGNIQLCTIKTMPAGRKPIITCAAKNQESVFRFIRKHIAAGRQAYIVCPMIDKNDDMDGVQSVEEISELYTRELEGDGISISTLTGRNSKEETAQIISDFRGGKTNILIATTVIEVGVNVPNANIIVIHNAERFGLAGLHQLRGRVGRGSYQSYCVLFTEDTENPRIKTMCETNDGFRIAEEDLKLRGSGELIGTRQSGDDRYMALMLAYPDRYEKIKEIASSLIDTGEADAVINASDGNSSKKEVTSCLWS